ncbi:DUF4382 domain-containing protein [Shewanella violacea]|uniref:DUF4382 domain-containing protein n=1 Tax=Shewanella violacea (strain JCM 10179 / CIP 106290 / LMG 19151 / DSS12) TaxID=637905 RepID=D4ZCX3_SHEVD|nr:DUF4382 domain-containing protein [Shewanella violacea]BAJ03868.1 conserved hypothetical protein [Shewanella violacea DSS12]
MKYTIIIPYLLLTGILTACGGGGSNSNSGSPDTPAPTSGTFSLGVSDNPALADKVNIAFKQVVLKGEDGSISFDVSDSEGNANQVDLLSVQGQTVANLVTDESVPLGEYQMCIYMENREVADETSSHVKVGEAVAGLVTNSNGSCGGVGAEEPDTGRLFLNKAVTITADSNRYVAEFNLAKGLQAPHGNKAYWTLKPTSVQLVNITEVGAISGSVHLDVLALCEMTEPGYSDLGLAVYLYPQDTLIAAMEDFRPLATLTAPLAASRANPVSEAEEIISYSYEFGFIQAGSYQLGFTCVADNDDPETEQGDASDPVFFIHQATTDNVDVIVGEVSVYDFIPPVI